jgi:hypothetical protein
MTMMDLDELARRHGIAYEMMGVTYNQVNPERIRALVNEVLEEAAKACDPTEEPHAYRYDPAAVYEALQSCAAKIRALKQP